MISALALACVAGASVDLSGIWLGEPQGRNTAGASLGLSFDPRTPPGEADKPPLTPEYAEKFQAAIEARRSGKPFPDPTADCLPAGMPRMMGMRPFPMEILMTPGKVTIVAEWMSQVRHIYIDGRAHPGGEDLDPSFNGHSIGHWEGNTLVADTVGLRADTLISQQGLTHSDATRVVERFRLRDGKLENEITIADAKMLTRPWTVVKTYLRAPKGTSIREYVCAEGLLERKAQGR
jgi:hypothetical protein